MKVEIENGIVTITIDSYTDRYGRTWSRMCEISRCGEIVNIWKESNDGMFCGWEGQPSEKFSIFLNEHFDEVVDETEAIELEDD